MRNQDGKIAVVAGAARGIGRAVATLRGHRGCHVAFVAVAKQLP